MPSPKTTSGVDIRFHPTKTAPVRRISGWSVLANPGVEMSFKDRFVSAQFDEKTGDIIIFHGDIIDGNFENTREIILKK